MPKNPKYQLSNTVWWKLGEYLDNLFVLYLLIMGIYAWSKHGNFMDGYNYFLLYGVWCISMLLMALRKRFKAW